MATRKTCTPWLLWILSKVKTTNKWNDYVQRITVSWLLFDAILRASFQPLDISINQSANKFISNKFNAWYADRVSKQLSNGVAPGDVKVSLKLSDLKHFQCSVDFWDMQSSETPKWFHYQRFWCCRDQPGYHMCQRCLHASRKLFRDKNRIFSSFFAFFSWKHNFIWSFESIDFLIFCQIYLPLSLTLGTYFKKLNFGEISRRWKIFVG